MTKKKTHENNEPNVAVKMPPIPPWQPSLGRIVLYVSPEQRTTVAPVVCPAILCAEPETMDSKQWGLTIFDMMGPRCVWAMQGTGPGEFFSPMQTRSAEPPPERSGAQ